MKIAKKLLGIVLCLAMLATIAISALPAMAADDTAQAWVNTTIGTDGTVELSRNEAAGNAWPRIRNIMGVESAPAIDLTVSNTLYYDITVTDCKFMLQIDFSGVEIKFGKGLAAANGTTLKNTDEDAPAGTYKGALNMTDYIKSVAADSADPGAANAQTVAKMTKSIVPGITLYVVDSATAGKIKVNSLYVSSAADTAGADCKQMSIDLLYPEVESTDPIAGVKFFPLDMNNGANGYDDVWEVEAGDNFYQRWNEAESANAAGNEDEDESSVEDSSKEDTAKETTAKKDTATTAKKGAADSGSNTTLIIIIVVAAVVVVAVVVVVVIMMKKKKDGGAPQA